jgi:hypothetical protein
MTTGALIAVGLAGAMTAGTRLAQAQSADKAKPHVPTSATVEGKVEARPGPLDVVVQFQGTAAQVDTNATASLDRTADWLREDPGHQITIAILPDEAARVGANAALVQHRADATRTYLIGRGVAPGQIKIVADARLPVGPTDRQHRALFLVSVAGDVAVAAAPTTAPADESTDIPVGEPFPAPPADVPDFDRDDREPVVMKATADHSDDHLLTPFGMAITVGGGVVGFFDDDARELGNLGGAWEARLTLGTRTPVAFEVAYVGTAQSIDALGLDSSALLVGTAVEGDLRVNFTTAYLQPYIFGGMGFTRYDLTNEDFNTSSVNGSERMGHIPFGAGLGFQYGGLLFDVRGTVRAAFSDDLVNEPATEDDPLDNTDTRTDLDTWSAAARIGWEF